MFEDFWISADADYYIDSHNVLIIKRKENKTMEVRKTLMIMDMIREFEKAKENYILSMECEPNRWQELEIVEKCIRKIEEREGYIL